MKKALSLLLAAALVSAGIAAMGTSASADEAAFVIDSEEKWNEFAESAGNYTGKTVEITADLDFTDKEFKVIESVACVIEGNGKTVKGVHRTIENADWDGRAYGILINNLTNDYPDFLEAEVRNLIVEDSSITVSVADYVDRQNAVYVGVIGELNRATVSGITVKNVSIEVSGKASVGVVAGLKEYKTHADVDNFGKITIEKTTIKAPDARVGILLGEMWAEGVTATADEVNASLTVEASTNEVGETTYVAAADQASFNAPADSTVTINPEPEASEPEPSEPEKSEPDPTKPENPEPAPKTGSASVVIAAVAIASLAGAVICAKKREQD